MYNAEEHERCEEIDDALFHDFLAHTKMFKEVSRCRQYSTIDYYGTDVKGRNCNIELKKRNCRMDKYPTCYIEPHKYWKLIEQYEQYKREPIYINFYDDGVIVFNLKNTDCLGAVPIKIRIWNGGYSEYQTVWRYELEIGSGFRYIKNKDGKFNLTNGRQAFEGGKKQAD